MRLTDILGLAIAALWQQKARTFLTTLGVIFGCFVLAASLSIGQGVQETIERQSRRNTHLREIQVHAGWKNSQADIPEPIITIKGNMSEDRRARIRKALVMQQLQRNPDNRRILLTHARLRELGKIEHIEQVVPFVHFPGRFILANQNGAGEVISAPHDTSSLRKLIIAGECFDTLREPSALVSELLLYELGITDDTAIKDVVGQKLRLEVRSERPGMGLGLFLQRPDGAAVTSDEVSGLGKIKDQLPALLDKFDLAPSERDLLHKALQAAPRPPHQTLSEIFTIVGVSRLPSEDEQTGRWLGVDANVFLPMKTAEDLFFRIPAEHEQGLDQTILLVDNERNVKEVLKQVRELGLNSWAPLEFIERERLLYLMIFGAMTCVAGVALLVAAIGIANTMLMSVLERTREVGIMKAVGAGNGHIQLIFLVEGAIIGLIGGGLGLLLSWVVSFPADSWVRSMVSRDLQIELKDSLFVFPPWLVLLVFLFAVLVTTLAAVYPARRAAKVNPVTALRHE